MSRRTGSALLLSFASAAAVLGGLLAPGSAAAAPESPVPVDEQEFGDVLGWVAPAKADHLTFTVRNSGSRKADGTYSLECRPAGGNHPAARAACARLERATRGSTDPFRPVSPDATCTKIYGGPATAHVRGTWHGREVDARFKRSNGCEMARWDALVPALPKAG